MSGLNTDRRLVFDPEEVAKRIGRDVQDWQGRCHTVAGEFLLHGVVEGDLEYGCYLGPVHPVGLFGLLRLDQVQPLFEWHGWIRTKDDLIVDPTRWVFENVEPYVAVIYPWQPEHAQYDASCQRWRVGKVTDPPRATGVHTITFKCDWSLANRLARLVNVSFRESANHEVVSDADRYELDLSRAQLNWMAGLPLGVLPLDQMERLYVALDYLGLRDQIPSRQLGSCHATQGRRC
jgi:hypothetical protein